MNALLIDENKTVNSNINRQCEAIYIFNPLGCEDTLFSLLLAWFPELPSRNIPIYFSEKLKRPINTNCPIYTEMSVEEMYHHYQDEHVTSSYGKSKIIP